MNDKKHQFDGSIRSLSTGQLITGILLIILGAIFLFARILGSWFISDFWPFFLIVGGLIFYVAYFARADKPLGYEGLLFPGTYLIVLGALFLLMNFIGWQNMRYLWPTFILAIPISLGVMYKFASDEPGRRKKNIFSSIKVLTIISIVLYLITAGGVRLWPLILILIGLVIIFKGFVKK